MSSSAIRSTASIAFPLRLCPLLLALSLAIIGIGCSGGGSNEEGGAGIEAPASPSGLEATSQDGAIGLDWGASSGADTYRVYRSTSSGTGSSESPLETGISSADYVDDAAENGRKYYYVVTAVASDGAKTAESDPSNEVEKTPFPNPPDRP